MGGVGGVAHSPAILRFLGVRRLPPLPPEHRIGDGGGEGDMGGVCPVVGSFAALRSTPTGEPGGEFARELGCESETTLGDLYPGACVLSGSGPASGPGAGPGE